MERPTVGEKRRLLIYLLCCMLAFLVLIGRLAYMVCSARPNGRKWPMSSRQEIV